MRVIAISTLRAFWEKHPDAEQPIKAWLDAPQALQCHFLKHEEHLMPLMVVAGAATDSGIGKKISSDQVLETI